MGGGSAPSAPGAVTPTVIQHRLGCGGCPLPSLHAGPAPCRLERGNVIQKEDHVPTYFIIQGSFFTTILLLVGTRGGARVSFRQHSG